MEGRIKEMMVKENRNKESKSITLLPMNSEREGEKE